MVVMKKKVQTSPKVMEPVESIPSPSQLVHFGCYCHI